MYGNLTPGQWKRLTGSGLVVKATGMLQCSGLLVAQSSSLVVSVYDGQDSSGTLGPSTLLVNQMPVVAGTPYPIPAILNNGLYILFVSGSGDLTAFYG